jgi:transcriptional regulator with XRE-family HTH domain
MKSLRGKWHRAAVTVLAASRHDAELTQEQLADRIGWHRSKIAKIEAGERGVDVDELILIAGGLKVEPAILFSRVLMWGGGISSFLCSNAVVTTSAPSGHGE